MKKKIFFILAGLFIIGMIAGCSTNPSSAQASYISLDSARSTALDAAGVDASSANITSTQLSERDGVAYYEVDFTAAGTDYKYAIDAMTGVVIESSNTNPADQSSVSALSANVGTVVDNNTDTSSAASKDGGTAASPSSKSLPDSAASSSSEVTLEQAKQIALDHAGMNSSQVTFVKAYKDFDDMLWIYEIEFIAESENGYQEYDYEIDAATGKILSYDYDAESYTLQPQGSTTKTEAEARSIALAKVPGAAEEDCNLWLDRDDGRLLYEGKIIYNLMEYEFKIDAYSGTILEWEAESIYH